uniref:SP-RING-type domain-containing protein n=1 Tax=Fagus sylvatica TaxID=28930 RepID=A0A2N9EG01_FAGSY
MMSDNLTKRGITPVDWCCSVGVVCLGLSGQCRGLLWTLCRESTNPLQNVEEAFQLKPGHMDLLRNTEYDVQAWCMLLNDSVSFRMQWPQYADLRYNGGISVVLGIIVSDRYFEKVSQDASDFRGVSFTRVRPQVWLAHEVSSVVYSTSSSLEAYASRSELTMVEGFGIWSWACDSDRTLKISGVPIRTVNRQPPQLLGANGRDDGALLSLHIREGINKISLSGCDARVFCFGIRLVKRLTVRQVLDLIPSEAEGELIEDALARVRRCTGGGVAAANDDSDSDVELIADSITVNLRCPMSGSRMKVAGRFKPCAHMGCFDLETLVELNQRSKKWQCPICLKNYSLEDIIIDPYFNRITTMMRNCGEDIAEINVKPDGSWSAKTRGEYSDLAQWHFPDGSLYIAKDEATSNLEYLRQIKQEDGIEEDINLKISMDKNYCGVTVSKHQHNVLSSRNQEENCENSDLNVITMSSSATGSGRDDENASINQDHGGHIDICTIDGNEINSIPPNSDPPFGILNGRSAPGEDAAIIILSDSEEENSRPCSLSALPNIPDSYVEDSALNVGVTSSLGLFNGSASGNVNEIGFSPWVPGFQLFGTDSDVSDAFIDLEHTPISCPAPMNCIGGASRSTVNSGGQVLDSSVCHTNNEPDNGLVDNPLAFVSEDPSLQNFLPTQPADMLEQPNMDHQHPASNGFEDWISLRVGTKGEGIDSDVGVPAVSPAANGLDLRNRSGSNEGGNRMLVI